MKSQPRGLLAHERAEEKASVGNGRPYSLIHDPLISVTFRGTSQKFALPEVYAALASNKVDDFPTLRPHQRHFWHAILCQVGAIAMINAEEIDPPETPERWSEILLELTQGEFPDEEPWGLVQPDITKPAFLQPGATVSEKATDYKKDITTPDKMDLPIGSKHHDVRDQNMRRATPEHWLFALVAQQTGGGYDGPRLYGVSRMNGGSGNRHGFSLSPSTRWGPHVKRDLHALAYQHRGRTVKHLLLWTRPWDGAKRESISLPDLDPLPLYIEIARRIRLEVGADGDIKGRYATSQSSRVHAKETKGMTQDPWTITETEKSVTISSVGFDYRQITKYLDPAKYTLPPLAKPVHGVDDNTAVHLIARTIVRGQGKTEGYYEKAIPLGRKASGMLKSPSEQAELHRIAEERVNTIGEILSILAHAVKTYLQDGDGGGKTKGEHQSVISNARRRLVQSMDRDFWRDLQQELESKESQRTRAQWCYDSLVPQARQILREVTKSKLCHRKDQYKATAESNDLFGRRIYSSRKLPERPAS